MKRLKAVGLVEVLVVLGIAAVSLTYVASINVKSVIRVKENEAVDLANGLMVQALEAAKSPTKLNIPTINQEVEVDENGNPIPGTVTNPDNNTTLFQSKFSIDYQDDEIRSIDKQLDNDPDITTGDHSCDESSPYYVSFADSERNLLTSPNICVQLEITQLDSSRADGGVIYEIKSRVTYKVEDSIYTNEIISYRRGSI